MMEYLSCPILPPAFSTFNPIPSKLQTGDEGGVEDHVRQQEARSPKQLLLNCTLRDKSLMIHLGFSREVFFCLKQQNLYYDIQKGDFAASWMNVLVMSISQDRLGLKIRLGFKMEKRNLGVWS